ncbi:MAG: hypothetical protein PHR30_18460 [Gallionellaceae bacterium]|nr:hypothetical protein [Gallionellaceae bacterium]
MISTQQLVLMIDALVDEHEGSLEPIARVVMREARLRLCALGNINPMTLSLRETTHPMLAFGEGVDVAARRSEGAAGSTRHRHVWVDGACAAFAGCTAKPRGRRKPAVTP